MHSGSTFLTSMLRDQTSMVRDLTSMVRDLTSMVRSLTWMVRDQPESSRVIQPRKA